MIFLRLLYMMWDLPSLEKETDKSHTIFGVSPQPSGIPMDLAIFLAAKDL